MTKILIIDDKKDNLTAVKALIKQLEPAYEVLTAVSGSAGIKLAKSKQPDTILLDIHMAQMDGYEVCRCLRADKKTELIPIIFLTAEKTSSKDRIQGLELGGDAFLTKPLDEGELLANLHAMLRIKKVEDELEVEKGLLEEKVKKRTQELQKLNEKYLDSYDNAPDMFASVDAKTSKILRCNQTLATALGYKKDEIIGQPIFYVYPSDCLEEAQKYFRQFVETGKIQNVELQLKRKDGGKIDVSLNVSAVRDKKGKVLYSRSIWRDITEFQLVKDKLIISENKRRIWLENSPVCTKIVDLDFNLQYMSSSGIKDLNIDDITQYYGKPYPFYFYPESFKILMIKNLKKVKESGKIIEQEAFVLDTEGKKLWYHSTLVPVNDEKDQLDYIMVVSLEITKRKHAEKEFRESEKKFRNYVETSQDLIWECDKKSRFTYLNPAWEEVTGYKLEEMLGRPFTDFTKKEEIERDKDEFSKHLKGGSVKGFPSTYISKKGSEIALIFNAIPKYDSKKNIIGTQGSAYDITERKLVEEKLKGSAALLKESQKVANLGSYVLDISSGFWKSSDILDEVFGIDQDYQRDINGWVKIVHPDERKEMLDYFTTHVLAEGRLFDKEYRIIRKNDQKEHWVHGLGKLEFDADGNPVKMIGTIQNITERKQAEQQLIKLSQSVEQSPASVMITNLNGELEYVNPKFEQLTGYSLDEIRGQNPRFLKSGVQSKDFYTELWQTLVSGKDWQGEFCNRKKNGDLYWERASISPIIDKNDSITHYVAVKEDITSRKKAREEIERLKDFNESILNGMAEGVVVMDPKGIIEYVNAAVKPLLGYSEEELRNRHQSLIVPQDQQIIVQEEDRLRISGERSTYELKLKRKNGQIINVKVSGSPRFKGGEYVGTMAVFTDITEQKIAQEKLKKAREYSQNLIDTSMDMIVSVDLGRRIHEFNPAAEKAFGYKKDEIFGKHVNLLYSDKNASRNVHKTTVSEGSHVTEIWNKRKNGEIFPSLLEASVLKDSKGNPIGVMGVSRDISKEKAAEKALRESEERYRELINIAPLGIAIHQEGKWVMVNRYTVALLGYENEEELLGQKAIDMIHPDYRKLFAKRIAEMAQTGKPVSATEQKVLKKDGSVLNAIATQAPITFHGKPAFEVAAMNITELRRAQKAVKESEEKFRIVIEQSNDGIYVLQEDRFVFTNPRFANLTGYKMDELSRDRFSFKSLFTDKGWAIVEEREVRRGRGEKLPGRYTFEGIRKNGRKRYWEVSVTEIDWDGNKATLGVLQDVTERIKARDKLEAALEKARDAEKVKTLFLTNMSHEIRTPLNSIMGFTELIEQSFKKKSGLEELEFFENVQESSKRLMHTVHEVLDMSQIESETLPVNLKKCDLAVLLEKALKPLLPEVKAKGLELNVNTVQNAFIRADENCVVQSIVNLVDNAIKYTEKGRIDIELKEKGNTLELKIKDTGIGIGKEYIKDIFHVFTQESSGYTKKYQGVGLGLALVKNYLELSNAVIAVKSKKGVGSTFTITFKKMEERRIKKRIEKPVKAATRIKPGVIKDKPQILVVEDDLSSQRLISFFLRDYYDIKFAASVFEAKEKLRANPIEMVLLDLSLLGNEDGLDLARYMRKSKKWPKTPIIAATAYAFTEDRIKCLEAGCNDYIAKPIIREKLIEKMKQQLKRA